MEADRTGTPWCILVVNDDEDSLFLLEHTLSQLLPTARILAVRSATEALALWKSEQVDAIVTDDRMPHITGVMLTRKIRESDPTLPILMVTGSDQSRTQALEAGVSVFYTGSDLDWVVTALRKCLSDRQAGGGR